MRIISQWVNSVSKLFLNQWPCVYVCVIARHFLHGNRCHAWFETANSLIYWNISTHIRIYIYIYTSYHIHLCAHIYICWYASFLFVCARIAVKFWLNMKSLCEYNRICLNERFAINWSHLYMCRSIYALQVICNRNHWYVCLITSIHYAWLNANILQVYIRAHLRNIWDPQRI